MPGFNPNAPATLTWTRKEVAQTRRLGSVREAVRVAMKELSRSEFFSACVSTDDEAYSGDEIVEIFQTGGLARRGYAQF